LLPNLNGLDYKFINEHVCDDESNNSITVNQLDPPLKKENAHHIDHSFEITNYNWFDPFVECSKEKPHNNSKLVWKRVSAVERILKINDIIMKILKKEKNYRLIFLIRKSNTVLEVPAVFNSLSDAQRASETFLLKTGYIKHHDVYSTWKSDPATDAQIKYAKSLGIGIKIFKYLDCEQLEKKLKSLTKEQISKYINVLLIKLRTSKNKL
jgi:hypothetical protein